MYEELDYYISAYATDNLNTLYQWHEFDMEYAIDLLDLFSDNDWNKLKANLVSKSVLWKVRLVEALDPYEENGLNIMLSLTDTNDVRLLQALVRSLRDIDFTAKNYLAEKVNRLLPNVEGSIRYDFYDFLRYYNYKSTRSPNENQIINFYQNDFTVEYGRLRIFNRDMTRVEIPDTVTIIGSNEFQNCKHLQTVTIPDSVRMIEDRAFYGCVSLKTVTIPPSVTSIEKIAFGNCTSLTTITIPDSLTIIGWGAFGNCTSLKNVNIPDSVTSIEDFAFLNCMSLTSVTISDSVTLIGWNAFQGCDNLTFVVSPGSCAAKFCERKNLPCCFVASSNASGDTPAHDPTNKTAGW